MKTTVWFLVAFVAMSATACKTTQQATGGPEVQIPDGYDITAQSGERTVIYGQRKRNCSTSSAPSFGWVEQNAITKPPTNGTLSDGGVGKRGSKSCGQNVAVRAVSYTSEPGFVGTDAVVFWDTDRVIITVVSE